MHAPTADQLQYFVEVLLPTYREFESELCSYGSPSPSESRLKRSFMLSAWAMDYFLDLVTGKDAAKQLTLEHTETGLRILRRVMDDVDYAKLSVSTHSLLGGEDLDDEAISEMLRTIPQLRVLVNVADEGEAPDMIEVDLFACLTACVGFWQDTLPEDWLE